MIDWLIDWVFRTLCVATAKLWFTQEYEKCSLVEVSVQRVTHDRFGDVVCVHSQCLDTFRELDLFVCVCFAVSSVVCVFTLDYCITVRWAWWDWELSGWLTTLLQCFDTADWVIRNVKVLSSKWRVDGVEWNVNPLTPTVAIWVQHMYKVSCARPG